MRINPDRIHRRGFVSSMLGGAAAASVIGNAIDTDIARRFPVGTRLRILPKHVCATGTQFSEYHAVAVHGTSQTWRRFDGW